MSKLILVTILVFTLPLNLVCQFSGIVTYSFYHGFRGGWIGARKWLR